MYSKISVIINYDVLLVLKYNIYLNDKEPNID